MELKVLGSDSRGNCYILETENEALIIEAGISFSDVKKALDYNISKVVGCLITHEHKDHCKYVKDFVSNAIPVYASTGTADVLGEYNRPINIIEKGEILTIGRFKVIAFQTKHDCADPVGFYINHEETGNILFATDTYYLPSTFKDLNLIMIECNYSIDILNQNVRLGRTHELVRNRIIQSHFSWHNCRDAILANDISKVNSIVLLHLSEANSNEDGFVREMNNATGKKVHAAKKGLIININKTPF